MPLAVQKYGGSSLATPDLIRALAERIVARYDTGDKLVIVVSAMGGTTNSLEAKAYALSDDPDPREVDMLISIGERESISLMAIAVNNIRPGLAVSFTGSQIGLITDTNHRNARILEIKGDRLIEALKKGRIPIIAGFQGVSVEKQITTLGRGGSDTTAVAVTAALSKEFPDAVCEIYSDVIGVYSGDPKLVESPVLIKNLDYETMLTISSLGAKVLKDAAVDYAHRLGVQISTGLSSSGEIGTVISNEATLDRNKYASLVYNDRLRFVNADLNDKCFEMMSKIRYLQRSASCVLKIYDAPDIIGSSKCFSVAITGSGLKSDPEKLEKMTDILENASNIIAIELSEIKFEVYVRKSVGKDTLNLIHDLFFRT
ncbi:MAG TPA: hypothetical protein PLK90_10515 [Clostridiales bacterium]|nr:hypothetical protein [Clostridiales bacterium]HQP70821.1 hypothetical protein [Clostridiales bacterium]